MEKLTKNIIADLVRVKAIQLNWESPFTWSSGIKSPLYIDNRIIGSFVITRQHVYQRLAQMVKAKFPHAQAILGVMTGGIIPAAFVAHTLKLPVGYIRQATKDHGLGRAIEGFMPTKTRVVLIEDTVSTGRTLFQSYRLAIKSGLVVLGAVSIFSYDLRQCRTLLNENTAPELHSLITTADLIAFYVEQPVLQQRIATFLQELNV